MRKDTKQELQTQDTDLLLDKKFYYSVRIARFIRYLIDPNIMFAFDTEVDRSSNKLSLTDHIILSTFDFGYVQ